jgi:hypothetical protein
MNYEYKTVIIPIEFSGVIDKKVAFSTLDNLNGELNDLGKDGWELVSVLPISLVASTHWGIHYLKRKLEE